MRVFLSVVLLATLMPLSAFSQDQSSDYRHVHESVYTVDSHTDTPLRLIDGTISLGSDNSGSRSCVDLPRMERGGLDGIFFAVFLGQGERTPEKNEVAFKLANRIIDTIESVTHRYADRCALVTTPEEALLLEKDGKRAIFLGIENGYPLGTDVSKVNYFYRRGVRYITLCHTKNNDICDSSNDTIGYNGLSEFGREVVKEMNRVGMMIDVSHISDSSFYQVLRLSKTPVIASHSCARAICDNPRNLTDDMLLKLKNNGGVIQMCILSDYVKKLPRNPQRDSAFKALRVKYRGYDGLTDDEMKEARKEYYNIDVLYPSQRATVSDAVDHIDHIVRLIGIDHVGIGTDFDGGGGLADCADVSQMPEITKELMKRGYKPEDIRKIWGGNLFRVMNEVSRFASMGK